MTKILIGTVAVMAIAIGVRLFVHLGLARPVTVSFETRGPMTLIFKDHLGPYHEILPTIRAVEAWAASAHLRCAVTFGEYLDDPTAVDEDRLRSRGGCVFDKPPPMPPPPELTVSVRPRRDFAVGHFDGSPSVGPYKVYPRVREAVAERRRVTTGPVLETYEVRGDEVSVEYLFPLDNAL